MQNHTINMNVHSETLYNHIISIPFIWPLTPYSIFLSFMILLFSKIVWPWILKPVTKCRQLCCDSGSGRSRGARLNLIYISTNFRIRAIFKNNNFYFHKVTLRILKVSSSVLCFSANRAGFSGFWRRLIQGNFAATEHKN